MLQMNASYSGLLVSLIHSNWLIPFFIFPFGFLLCSRKLGETVILYNELKLFASLNCFNMDNLLLNFSQ